MTSFFLISVLDLIKEVFNIKANVYYYEVKYEIRFSSRIVYEILNRMFQFPDGEKKDRLHIPKEITEHSELSKMFLKGLFSTDGTLTFSSNYPRLSVASASFDFVNEIYLLLKNLNFKPHINLYNRKIGNKLYNIRLNGFEQLTKFYKEINFIGEKLYKLERLTNYNSPII